MTKQTSARSSSTKKKRTSEPPAPITRVVLKPTPSHAQIAERAFARYEARGRTFGDPLEDWLVAERELSA